MTTTRYPGRVLLFQFFHIGWHRLVCDGCTLLYLPRGIFPFTGAEALADIRLVGLPLHLQSLLLAHQSSLSSPAVRPVYPITFACL
jgi:hypothetical protein